jgi:tight adherence protein C
MTIVIILGILLGITVIIIGITIERKDKSLEGRLARYAQSETTLEEMELSLPFRERVLLPPMRRMTDTILRLTPNAQVSLTRQNMIKAGLLNKMSVNQFQTRRLTVALALSAGFVFYGGLLGLPPLTSFAIAAPLAVLGFMLPSMWLGKKVKQRQKAIQRALPDAIDLLTVCVEAGSGFDASLARVVQKRTDPLAEELERLLADLRMGRVRRDALKDLADRTGVSDVQSFVSALIQADLLGVGLVKVLRVQSDQMRQQRRLRAEEAALKAPIKMLFPMILMIFPAVYIIILGPAAVSLAKGFGGG